MWYTKFTNTKMVFLLSLYLPSHIKISHMPTTLLNFYTGPECHFANSVKPKIFLLFLHFQTGFLVSISPVLQNRIWFPFVGSGGGRKRSRVSRFLELPIIRRMMPWWLRPAIASYASLSVPRFSSHREQKGDRDRRSGDVL